MNPATYRTQRSWRDAQKSTSFSPKARDSDSH
jgi:hypothetical protein